MYPLLVKGSVFCFCNCSDLEWLYEYLKLHFVDSVFPSFSLALCVCVCVFVCVCVCVCVCVFWGGCVRLARGWGSHPVSECFLEAIVSPLRPAVTCDL